MWILVTEKSLKLCFFLLVVFFFFFFFSCTGNHFLNQSIRDHSHTLIHEANCDQLLSRNRARLYTYRNLYITLFFFVVFVCFYFLYFSFFWRYGPNEKIYKIKIKNYLNLPSLRSYHIMKKKLKTLY